MFLQEGSSLTNCCGIYSAVRYRLCEAARMMEMFYEGVVEATDRGGVRSGAYIWRT